MSPAVKPRDQRPHIAMVVILTISFVLKLAILLSADAGYYFVGGDTKSYWPVAEALLEHGAFAPSPEEPETAETIRTPGYPLFMAAALGVWNDLRAVVLVQILVSTLTLWLVYQLAAWRWGPWTGALAVTILALDPGSFAHSLLVLTESLFTLLFAAAVGCAAVFSERWQTRWIFAAGVCLALAIHVRPIAYYFPMLLFAWLLFSGFWVGLRPGRIAKTVVAFLLPLALLVGGWQVRNQLRTGYSAFSSISGINLLFYRGAGVVALRDKVDLFEARRQLTGFSEFGRDVLYETPEEQVEPMAAIWTRQGLAVLKAHPGLVLQTQARSVIPLFLGIGHHALLPILGREIPPAGPLGDLLRLDAGTYAERWVFGRPLLWSFFVAEEGYLLAVYLLVLVWPWLAFWRVGRQASDHCFWLGLLYLVAISLGPEAVARFRVPLMPLLALYAAASAVYFLEAPMRRWAKSRNSGNASDV